MCFVLKLVVCSQALQTTQWDYGQCDNQRLREVTSCWSQRDMYDHHSPYSPFIIHHSSLVSSSSVIILHHSVIILALWIIEHWLMPIRFCICICTYATKQNWRRRISMWQKALDLLHVSLQSWQLQPTVPQKQLNKGVRVRAVQSTDSDFHNEAHSFHSFSSSCKGR